MKRRFIFRVVACVLFAGASLVFRSSDGSEVQAFSCGAECEEAGYLCAVNANYIGQTCVATIVNPPYYYTVSGVTGSGSHLNGTQISSSSECASLQQSVYSYCWNDLGMCRFQCGGSSYQPPSGESRGKTEQDLLCNGMYQACVSGEDRSEEAQACIDMQGGAAGANYACCHVELEWCLAS